MSQLFRRILCPVDFDDNSIAALDLACKLAAQNKATLYVLHVAATPIAASKLAPIPLEPYPVWEHDARVRLERIAREHLEGQVLYEVVTRSGIPGSVILDVEKELGADLVVMATHGRSGIGHLLLGSVAEKVVRESLKPVLVVSPPAKPTS